MGDIKSRYTLAEAAEYLKRETETPELSVHDLVTLAAEGNLSVCFPYKGQLGLFKSGKTDPSTESELAQSIFGRALKTFYFNGILRSLSRPAPGNEITDLRGHTRKSHTLHPVRVVPVCVFSSVPPVEPGEPVGHHWRRVYGSRHSWAGTQLTAAIPEAEWMIESESLYSLADENTGVASPSEPGRRVISTTKRRNTLTPVIERAQQQCRDCWDSAEVWGVLSAMAAKKEPPLLGATEDGLQWHKDGDVAILSRSALTERIKRMRSHQATGVHGSTR